MLIAKEYDVSLFTNYQGIRSNSSCNSSSTPKVMVPLRTDSTRFEAISRISLVSQIAEQFLPFSIRRVNREWNSIHKTEKEQGAIKY